MLAGRWCVRLLRASARKRLSCVDLELPPRRRKVMDESAGDDKGQRLVWVDMEMTGLDVNTCHILEVACIVTDGQLNIIAEGPDIVVHQSDEVLEGMEQWSKEHHGKSGLTEASRTSKISLEETEEKLLEFVSRHTPKKECPLAGNSVHADRNFLVKYMPKFMGHLHYRIVDVSTVKELCRRWNPEAFKNKPEKKMLHRALEDIKESITELQFYRDNIFGIHQ